MRLRVRVYAPALSLMAPCLVRCAGGIIISITVVIVLIISNLVVIKKANNQIRCAYDARPTN